MKSVSGEQKVDSPRSADAERRAIIRAYAEHGQAVPQELEAQKQAKSSDKKSEEKQLRKVEPMSDPQPQNAPVVNSNPGSNKDSNVPSERKLSTRALERTVDAGIVSVFALATVTGSALIVRKING